MKIQSDVSCLFDTLVQTRRDLHQIPELSLKEEKTANYIYHTLSTYQPDALSFVYGTGVKAVFLTKNAKKTIAFRADMDALPVTEETGLPFASTHQNTMHACGHDGHMAMVLTLAHYVAKHRDTLSVNVVFLFEPGEEGEGGALQMINKGVLENPSVDEIYGFHIWPYLEAGKIGLKPGPLMASVTDFDIELFGKEAHGANPKSGISALDAATAFMVALKQKLPAEVTLNFGKILGGRIRNIVCGHVLIEGTFRTFEETLQEQMITEINNLLAEISSRFSVKTSYQQVSYYPPIHNHAELVKKLESLLSEEEWVLPSPEMMSEDFSNFQKYVPGVFLFLGSKEPGFDAPLHSGTFTFREELLLNGLELMVRILKSYE